MRVVTDAVKNEERGEAGGGGRARERERERRKVETVMHSLHLLTFFPLCQYDSAL